MLGDLTFVDFETLVRSSTTKIVCPADTMPACGYGTALRDFTAVIDHVARDFVLSVVQSIECGAPS